jgi:hypothetical protein
MDILYRNYTSEELQDRTCKVIDYVMLPACSSRHMEKVVDDCALRNITRRIHYVWSTLSKCRGGIQKLPEPIQIGCSYIPLMAPLNLFMTIFSLFMVGLIIMIMYLLIKYRSRPTIRYSSNTFTLIYLVGCILCCVSVGFKAGDAKFKPCGIDIWILGYGYILVIGTLTLKMWRLVSVVNNTKISRSVKISDQTLINYLLGMVAVQTVILVMWQLFDKPAYITSTKTLLGTDIDYSETVCSIQSNSITLVGVAINLILVLNLVYLVIQGRKIPSKFNDGKLMAIIIYTLTFILTITIATSIFIADTQAQYTLQSSAILLAVFCCSAIYTAPKIYGAIMNRELEGSNSSINMVATSDDKLCIHCGKSQKVLNSVPAARSPSTNKT